MTGRWIEVEGTVYCPKCAHAGAVIEIADRNDTAYSVLTRDELENFFPQPTDDEGKPLPAVCDRCGTEAERASLTVGELRRAIADLPDDALVAVWTPDAYIPATAATVTASDTVPGPAGSDPETQPTVAVLLIDYEGEAWDAR